MISCTDSTSGVTYKNNHLLMAPNLLCNQYCNDFLVTFNLCPTSGLLVELSSSVNKLFLCVNCLKFKSDARRDSEFVFLLSAFFGPAKRTSSPNSSCSSLIIALFTSKLCVAGSVTALLTPKVINMSSLTECPAKINQSNVNM